MLLLALPIVIAVAIAAYGVVYVLVDYARILRLRKQMAPSLFLLPFFGNIF